MDTDNGIKYLLYLFHFWKHQTKNTFHCLHFLNYVKHLFQKSFEMFYLSCIKSFVFTFCKYSILLFTRVYILYEINVGYFLSDSQIHCIINRNVVKIYMKL